MPISARFGSQRWQWMPQFPKGDSSMALRSKRIGIKAGTTGNLRMFCLRFFWYFHNDKLNMCILFFSWFLRIFSYFLSRKNSFFLTNFRSHQVLAKKQWNQPLGIEMAWKVSVKTMWKLIFGLKNRLQVGRDWYWSGHFWLRMKVSIWIKETFDSKKISQPTSTCMSFHHQTTTGVKTSAQQPSELEVSLLSTLASQVAT